MPEHQPPAHPKPALWSRRKRILVSAIVVLISLLLIIIFAPFKQLLPGKTGLEISAKVFQSVSSHSTNTSNSGQGPLRMRRVALLVLDDHAIMDRLAPIVADAFTSMAEVDEFTTVHADHLEAANRQLPKEQPLNDLYILLDMRACEVTDIAPIGRQVKTTMTLQVGPNLLGVPYDHDDDRTISGLQINLETTLEHEIKTVGYASGDARFKAVSEDLGETLAKLLKEKFTEWIDTNGRHPRVPSPFTPAYQPFPHSLPLPAQAVLLTSGHRPLSVNETTWVIQSDDLKATLAQLEQALEADGWHLTDRYTQHALQRLCLRATRRNGDEIYRVFKTQTNNASFDRFEPDNRIAIQYTKKLSIDRVRDVIEALPKTTIPEIEAVVPFTNLMTKEQRKSIAERLLEHQSRGETFSLDTAWQLAKQLRHQGKTEQAIRLAARTWWRAEAADREHQSETIQKQLTQWRDNHYWEPAALRIDGVQALGFPVLTVGDQLSLTAGLDSPALFALPADDRGGYALVGVTLMPPLAANASADNTSTYRMCLSELQHDSQTHHTSAVALPTPWRRSDSIEVNGLRLEVTATEQRHAKEQTPVFELDVNVQISNP